MLETIKRPKIRDVVATKLKAYIVSENLKTGDRLPTETELAARFGVSRLSLREATKALEFLGIVESKPGCGLTVGHVNMDRVTEFLGFHPRLQDVSSTELIDSRVLIEIGVLPHVARRMACDNTIYEHLNEINNELRRARSLQRWIEHDIAFHRGLIEASGLSPLMAFSDLLAVFFQKFREGIKMAEWKLGIASHQRILESLKARDVQSAEQELKTHIESHRGRLGE